MKFHHLLLTTCISAVAVSTASNAFAQVEITDERTSGISTSTAGTDGNASDVTITSTGSIAVTTGAAVTVDSDNDVTNSGIVSSEDADDTTGILVDQTVTSNITNTNSISLTETAPEDGVPSTGNGTIAQGSGRTGILISGGSTFTGNVENSTNASIRIQGQDSAGIRLANTASMVGDLLQSGSLTVFGENSTGVDIIGNVIGNLALAGAISATGENSVGVNVGGDVTGAVTVSSSISSSGYVTQQGQTITSRPILAGRDELDSTGNLTQAGSALQVGGNVTQGIQITEIGTVAMFGSAPAILIDGGGTPIAIGQVGQITDPNDEDFDENLQFAFVNQGTLASDSVLDNIDATAFSLANATLDGGINNTSVMSATVYRSGIDPDATAATNDAHARVIVIGGNGIAERINNSGTIFARGVEDTESVYADPDNVLAPNQILVTAIEIDPGGSLSEITNTGTLTAIITGRNGEARVLVDRSGTLHTVNNSGFISALGVSSDVNGEQDTDFNFIAIDVSANTAGFTLNQTPIVDTETGEENDPAIAGDIILGSGADTLNIAAGTVNSDIEFGAGADTLALSNGSVVTGAISDSGGDLTIMVADSSALTITAPGNINATSANFDATSTYSPFIDPAAGTTSLLNASGDVTFESGAIIAPRLANVIDDPTIAFEIARAGGTLSFDELAGSLRSDATPFLYNTNFTRSVTDPNTLVLTLDLRSTSELGLDNVQAAAFTSAFEALQNAPNLGSAFTGITDQVSFNAAYNQLLPEFAASARQFVLANVDGATGAVGSHLNTARRSPERPGGAWIEEFAYFADRDLAGLSEQFRGYGFGITGGLDTSFGPFQTVGVNFGFASTEVEDVLGVDEPLDVLTLQGGLYAGYQVGKLGIDLYAGGGYNDFEASRNVEIGTYSAAARGDWKGTHYNASASAGYDISFGKYYVRPSATFSYLRLNEDAFVEEGSADIALAIDSREAEVGTATGLLDIGARFERERSWFAPALRLGIRNDFINDGVMTTGNFVSGSNPFALTSEEFPDTGIVLGITFSAGSNYSSFSLDYDADIRDGFNRHTARLVVRMLF
ncbi:MAG: autotransporter domain-containing protein [Hyphomonadaceae bacterium]|nr:autotransporter domain-containing protein [Hyphomonadaceae bacterium]